MQEKEKTYFIRFNDEKKFNNFFARLGKYMNRIRLHYTPKTKKTDSHLIVLNDIEGHCGIQIGPDYTGLQADLMFRLLSAVDYSKLDDCVCYGIRIRNSEGFYEDKIND